jgi:hypothetical protein
VEMKPVSPDINELPGRHIRAAVERLSNGLIAASNSTKRVDTQQRIHDPGPCATVQTPVNAHDGSNEECKEKRRPDPPQRVDDHAAGCKAEKSGAGQRHEAGERERPALWLLGPQHRERRKQRPTCREREQDGTRDHVFLRSATGPTTSASAATSPPTRLPITIRPM